MMKIAVAGYGALGIAVQRQAEFFQDIDLCAVFTRREVSLVKNYGKTPLFPFDEIKNYKGKFDVVLNCMGSANDLPVTTPYLSQFFNVVDSFDDHPNFAAHKRRIERYTNESKFLALVGCGWDPGIFSLFRLFSKAFFQNAATYTVWGAGVSRGHTNAVKNLEGVLNAVSYTVPRSQTVEKIKNGFDLPLSSPQLHKRVCYVVPVPGADIERIEREIKQMKNYFEPYETQVNFIDDESFLQQHKTANHAGLCLCNHKDESLDFSARFSVQMSSNPDFTARIMLAFSKAVLSLWQSGKSGCITMAGIAPSELFGDDSKKLSALI